MKRAPAGLVFAVGLGLFSPLASAQTPAAAPSADDAAMAAQKAAFMGLPEASRKAVQEALVWLGLYVGVNDGDFGKRTRDAILAFQASLKAPADGTLSAPELKALLAAAQKAREAAGFQVVSDPKTGAKIGAPLKLLRALPGARLDFASNADADLSALYARLSAATPTRKIAYKAIKPDAFFVVSGQDGPVKFYTRFDKNPAASPPIRGFTFAYPASQTATLDRIAIAIANSFEPFPEARPPAPASKRRSAPPASSSASAPAVPQPAATALVVAPGKALTALKTDDCPKSDCRGQARQNRARRRRNGPGDTRRRFRLEWRSAPARLASAGSRRPRIRRTARCGKLGLVHRRRGAPVVTAAVDKGASGGPVFDRSGALVGLVAPIAGEPKRVGSVALASPHPLIAPDALRAFLGAGEPASEGAASLSAGDIAARERKALVAVFCQQ